MESLWLSGGNIELVKRKVPWLKKILKEFEGAHVAYHELLKIDRDVDECNLYFVEVKRGIEEITGDVATWVVSSEHAKDFGILLSPARAIKAGPDTEINPNDSASNVPHGLQNLSSF